MPPLSTCFAELHNGLYMNAGHILSRELSPELNIILDSVQAALGRSLDGCTGDYILMVLRQRGEADLCRELRSAITLRNAEVNYE